MMPREVLEALSRQDSLLHDRLLEFGRNRIIASKRFWSQRHPDWQEAERLNRSFRDPDDEDIEVRNQGITENVTKIVVPQVYAQVQSILAWMLTVFTERSPIIPVEGVGPQDVVPAILHEQIAEYQFDNMEPRGGLVIYQWFHDALVYGFGAIKNTWSIREFPRLVNRNGVLVEEDITAYEGNEALNVIPYDFFPDPRRPIGEFQKGEFCSHHMRRSHTEILQKQAQGMYAGVRFIPKRSNQQENKVGIGNRFGVSELSRTMHMGEFENVVFDEEDRPYVDIDELWTYLNPEALGLPVQVAGLSQTPRLWVLTIANESRVLRAEPANLPAMRFPFEVLEFNYNVHSPANQGVPEVIKGLQYHQSWLYNSRMQNVRRSLNNETLIDPSLIEEMDLAHSNASGFIRLNKNAYAGGIPLNQIAMPFPTADVTASHHTDARITQDLIEQITGANRLIQGLANTGRRSATETQGQLSLAAGRMRVFALVAAIQGLSNWARQMTMNTQTFIQTEMPLRLKDPYNKVLGRDSIVMIPELLQGNFRFPFLEAGMPTDRFFEANMWRELFAMGMQSGFAAPVLQRVNFLEVFARLMTSMNVKNVDDFFFDGRFPAATAEAQAQGGIQVVPDEQVERQVESGNLIASDGFPLAQGAPGAGANGAAVGA